MDVGVWVGVWRTCDKVSPLATVEDGREGGVDATLMTLGKLLLLELSLFGGFSAAGKIIWGYCNKRN